MRQIWVVAAIVAMGLGLIACSPKNETQLSADPPLEFINNDVVTLLTVDDRDLVYYIDRPVTDERVPIVLVVDGSSCIGQLRPTAEALYRPSPDSPHLFARVMVEKPGVEATAEYPSDCSEEFFKHYTIEQRLIDHLRALQHLSATAQWWDGTLYVWGWSDGGDIAGQLVAYYPNVERAVLGAMGGGYTMEEHFKDYWVCSEERAGDRREACIQSLDEQFTAMFDNPTWTKTWSGDDNSWKIWPTRLRSRLSNILADNQTPILIVQGAEDFDSTPAASARKLVSDLEAAGNNAFTYWEIPGMKHGWGSLPDGKGDVLKKAMFDWLFEEDPQGIDQLLEGISD